jgi:hypothetical protein
LRFRQDLLPNFAASSLGPAVEGQLYAGALTVQGPKYFPSGLALAFVKIAKTPEKQLFARTRNKPGEYTDFWR